MKHPFKKYFVALQCLAAFAALAKAQSVSDTLQRYLDAGAVALTAANEPEGKIAFQIFRQAVIAAAKRSGDSRKANILAAFAPGKIIPAEHRAPATRLLRKYFLARYGDKLGPDLSALLKFRTEALPNQENWFLPEFVKQRQWLEQRAAELGLAFRSYDGRVDEITLADGDSVIPVLTHGHVVDVEGQTCSSPPWEGRIVDGNVMSRGAHPLSARQQRTIPGEFCAKVRNDSPRGKTWFIEWIPCHARQQQDSS